MTFELEPDALRVTHDGLDDDDERDGVQSSWLVALRVLEHYVTHHFGKPRAAHWTVIPAASTAPAVHVFYSDPHALNAWLTKDGTGIGPTPLDRSHLEDATLLDDVLECSRPTPGLQVGQEYVNQLLGLGRRQRRWLPLDSRLLMDKVNG